MAGENVDQIRSQFTRQAQAYADTAQAKDDAAHAKLAELVGLRSTDRVLDVACGPGFLTCAFAARCAEAVGVDATDALLDIARANARERGSCQRDGSIPATPPNFPTPTASSMRWCVAPRSTTFRIPVACSPRWRA